MQVRIDNAGDGSIGTWTFTKRELVAFVEFVGINPNQPVGRAGFDYRTGDAIATDGKTCLCVGVSWRPTGDGTTIQTVPRADLEAVIAETDNTSTIQIVLGASGGFIRHAKRVSRVVKSGVFPPTYSVYPETLTMDGAAPMHALDARYLARLLMITEATGARDTNTVEVYGTAGEGKPTLVLHRFGREGPVWSVLLMPIYTRGTIAPVQSRIDWSQAWNRPSFLAPAKAVRVLKAKAG